MRLESAQRLVACAALLYTPVMRIGQKTTWAFQGFKSLLQLRSQAACPLRASQRGSTWSLGSHGPDGDPSLCCRRLAEQCRRANNVFLEWLHGLKGAKPVVKCCSGPADGRRRASTSDQSLAALDFCRKAPTGEHFNRNCFLLHGSRLSILPTYSIPRAESQSIARRRFPRRPLGRV